MGQRIAIISNCFTGRPQGPALLQVAEQIPTVSVIMVRSDSAS
jgi:hypothetical protein